jgi:hypothetical protein
MAQQKGSGENPPQQQQAQPQNRGASGRKPTGSSKTEDGRPRAQVAFEGDDAFSIMSTAPARREKKTVELEPLAPGAREQVHIDEMKPKKKSNVVGFFRKIFAK